MNTDKSNHLTTVDRINLGSYYTPAKYVQVVASWLKQYGVDNSYAIADLSCGYGAFFQLANDFPLNSFVGNDIDAEAAAQAKKNFPFVNIFNLDCLSNITRAAYGLTDNDKLVIVGNPPYNDTTSLVGKNIKTQPSHTAPQIKARDLGIASLQAYNLLKADYVAVLHPLSYLVKATNFRSGAAFFNSYQLLEHIVFSSQEFTGTSRLNGFPVVVGLYRRTTTNGLTYSEVLKMRFKTVEGRNFAISDRQYVSNFIPKYPHKRRFSPEILFYTLRDVNALARCRTFLKERCANAVDVDPAKLAYYCYLDCFKKFATIPYWMGNLDVPFIAKDFDNLSADFIAVAQSMHPDIFPTPTPPSPNATERVRNYINRVVDFQNDN